MSRSYKYPIWKQHNDTYYKKYSNKLIRRELKKLTKGFKSSKFFKIIVNPWDICDWKTIPWKEKDIIKSKRK